MHSQDSVTEDILNLASASTVKEFIDRKLRQLALDRKILSTFIEGIDELREAGKITAVKHDESVDALQKHATSVDRENLILRRQRKFVEEDLDDVLRLQDQSIGDLTTAYRSLLASKLASRIYHQRKDLDDDIVIQRCVTKYFNAYRCSGDDRHEAWCPLSAVWRRDR